MPGTVAAAVSRRQLHLSIGLAVLLLACSATRRPAPAVDQMAGLRVPAARRVVAIGDLHGDLAAARAALRLAGAIDGRDRWIGGDLVVVQVGDQLDRGDDEQAIVDLFDRLHREAAAAGGAVHSLLGNHEIMNARGELDYVTPGGLADFADVPGLALDQPRLQAFPPAARPRAAALLPGGPYARILAERHLFLAVGDTLFVHGGILPGHVRYGLGRLDRETRAWLAGERDGPPPPLVRRDAPVWTRLYSAAPGGKACATLGSVLVTLHAKRMVVGHTIQPDGIHAACDGQVWMIDVGMAGFAGGRPQVLEITAAGVRALH